VGWAFLMGLQDKQRSIGNGVKNIILTIIWIVVAIALWVR